MDDAHDGPYAREPQVEDLTRICQALNDVGARYILIGGFAAWANSTTTSIRSEDTAGLRKLSVSSVMRYSPFTPKHYG